MAGFTFGSTGTVPYIVGFAALSATCHGDLRLFTHEVAAKQYGAL